MNGSDFDHESAALYKLKFRYETIRTVVFWLGIVLATYFIFKPIDAENEFEEAIRRLNLEHQRVEGALTQQYRKFTKEKVFEQRLSIIDDFIIKSDAHTKAAYEVFQSGGKEGEVAYKGITVDEYHLNRSRLLAIFGDDLKPLVDEAKVIEDSLFELYKALPKEGSSGQLNNNWRAVLDSLVSKNTEITNEATSIQIKHLNSLGN